MTVDLQFPADVNVERSKDAARSTRTEWGGGPAARPAERHGSRVPPSTEANGEDLATAEIDAEAVVEELRRFQSADFDSARDFSLECTVDWVPWELRKTVEIEPCVVCGGRRGRPRFEVARGEYRLVDCTECGVGRLDPFPDANTIRQFYPRSYYGVAGAKFVPLVESLVRVVGSRHARALSRGLAPRARVLDIGCGRGVLLSTLADRGFQVHGFEISAEAAKGADPRADIRVGDSLAEAGYPDAFFDQVILWHVLEHLPEPRRTLVEIRRLLKPGGRLAVAVPNYGSLQARWFGPAWFHLDLPRHLFDFPVRALRRLLRETGFAPRREDHFSLRQNPFGWIQSGLNQFRSLPRNGLYSLLKSRDGSSPLYDGRTRALFRAAYACGMPLGFALSGLEALCRRGGSVCVVAETRRD